MPPLLLSVHLQPPGHFICKDVADDNSDDVFVTDDSMFEGAPVTRTTATTATRKINHLERRPSLSLTTRSRIPKTCNVTIFTDTVISHIPDKGASTRKSSSNESFMTVPTLDYLLN